MAKIKHHSAWEYHHFVVEGRGEFPFDMLRHSEAWPADAESAFNLGNYSTQRRIMLIARNGRWVSPERWASFGWRVVAGFENGYATEIEDHHAAMQLEDA